MTMRHILTALALCMMALALFLGCVSEGPPPSYPMEEPPPPSSPPPQGYFVTVDGLALREGPTTAAPQVGTLQFNDEVQIMETSGSWARVVDVRRNRTGWASMRYLQPMPADRPHYAPRRPAPAPKEQPEPAESPKVM